MNTEELQQLVLLSLEDMKAQDIAMLDLREKSSVTDLMIVASGTSSRQVKAMADKVIEACKARGVVPIGVEGEAEAEWLLVDLGDVIVHLMQPAVREYYQLEKLWQLSPSAPSDAR